MIGVEFDENTEWEQFTILELKLLINPALGQHEEALVRVGIFLQYNDNTLARNLHAARAARFDANASSQQEP